MRRADRLFRIVEYLKARRFAVKAQDIADELEVSVRTIYRDIADLSASGTPIIGEAGIGYMLDRDYVIKPLMFDKNEIEALMLGIEMVKTIPDLSFQKTAQSAMDKITSVLPEKIRNHAHNAFLFSFNTQTTEKYSQLFEPLRKAIEEKRIITFTYVDTAGVESYRILKPLALAQFSPVWLLLGWSDQKSDFRNFRLDRISELQITDQHFKDQKSQTLKDFLDKEKKRG